MKKRILGLDVSSTCTGICLLIWDTEANQIELGELTHFNPIKSDNILERLRDTRNQMIEIIDRLHPDEIAIEDIITFMPKRSSANTIITLAVFNRMLGLLSFDFIDKSPTLYPVMAIRRGLQLEGYDVPQKEDMPELVAQYLNIDFPWEYNRNDNPHTFNFDRADACAVALFHTFNLMGKFKTKPKITKIKVKKSTSRKKKVKKK